MAGKLANVRHEAFCRYVSKDHLTYAAAYVRAGFSEGGKMNASSLAKRQDVAERIEELLAIYEFDEEADDHTLKTEIQDMLTQIVVDGNPSEASIKSMLVRCVHAGVKGAPTSSAVAALRLLGQERGMFQDKPRELTPAEKARAIVDESHKPKVIPSMKGAKDAFFEAMVGIGENPVDSTIPAPSVDPELILGSTSKITKLFDVEVHDDEAGE